MVAAAEQRAGCRLADHLDVDFVQALSWRHVVQYTCSNVLDRFAEDNGFHIFTACKCLLFHPFHLVGNSNDSAGIVGKGRDADLPAGLRNDNFRKTGICKG